MLRLKLTPIVVAAAVLAAGAAVAAETASRDAAHVAAVIALHHDEVTAIYDTYLNAGVEVAGKVVVRFTIAPTGAVTASEVAAGTTGCKLFEEAVAAAVAAWDFGPAPTVLPVTILYPFSFTMTPDDGL